MLARPSPKLSGPYKRQAIQELEARIVHVTGDIEALVSSVQAYRSLLGKLQSQNLLLQRRREQHNQQPAAEARSPGSATAADCHLSMDAAPGNAAGGNIIPGPSAGLCLSQEQCPPTAPPPAAQQPVQEQNGRQTACSSAVCTCSPAAGLVHVPVAAAAAIPMASPCMTSAPCETRELGPAQQAMPGERHTAPPALPLATFSGAGSAATSSFIGFSSEQARRKSKPPLDDMLSWPAAPEPAVDTATDLASATSTPVKGLTQLLLPPALLPPVCAGHAPMATGPPPPAAACAPSVEAREWHTATPFGALKVFPASALKHLDGPPAQGSMPKIELLAARRVACPPKRLPQAAPPRLPPLQRATRAATGAAAGTVAPGAQPAVAGSLLATAASAPLPERTVWPNAKRSREMGPDALPTDMLTEDDHKQWQAEHMAWQRSMDARTSTPGCKLVPAASEPCDPWAAWRGRPGANPVPPVPAAPSCWPAEACMQRPAAGLGAVRMPSAAGGMRCQGSSMSSDDSHSSIGSCANFGGSNGALCSADTPGAASDSSVPAAAACMADPSGSWSGMYGPSMPYGAAPHAAMHGRCLAPPDPFPGEPLEGYAPAGAAPGAGGRPPGYMYRMPMKRPVPAAGVPWAPTMPTQHPHHAYMVRYRAHPYMARAPRRLPPHAPPPPPGAVVMHHAQVPMYGHPMHGKGGYGWRPTRDYAGGMPPPPARGGGAYSGDTAQGELPCAPASAGSAWQQHHMPPECWPAPGAPSSDGAHQFYSAGAPAQRRLPVPQQQRLQEGQQPAGEGSCKEQAAAGAPAAPAGLPEDEVLALADDIFGQDAFEDDMALLVQAGCDMLC